MLHADRNRALSFGGHAERYDRARPSYPAELVSALLDDLGGAPRVLDIGAGTGIASSLFAAAGASVLAVEADPRMAAIAIRRGLAVEVAHFESWQPNDRRFELAISAQAWHWIDPTLGAERLAGVLAAHGRVGLFWNHGRPAGVLAAELAALYGQLAPALASSSPLLGADPPQISETRSALDHCGHFAPSVLRVWEWSRSYRGAEWVELLATHSDHHMLEAREELLAAIAAAIERHGGTVDVRYVTRLLTTTLRGLSSSRR